MINGTVKMLLFPVFSDNNRRFIIAFLTAIHSEGETRSAAAIAALLGHMNARDGLEMAKNKFRAISVARLKEADFSGNTEDVQKQQENDKKGDINVLFGMTQEVQLGCCDVFLSHSWSDCGKKKYDALARWAKEFKKQNGRDPVIWLDKACINQKDIASDLLCLPVFLAGCQNLLIIAGPTYTRRLWCILEVFVFLKMGGNIRRVYVLPIDMESEQEAKDAFDSADVSKCKCYLEADKQKILGIIEQGFGNFTEFNEIIRHVFKERMTVTHTMRSRLRTKRRSSLPGVAAVTPISPIQETRVTPIEDNQEAVVPVPRRRISSADDDAKEDQY